jgi:hypothetical protein
VPRAGITIPSLPRASNGVEYVGYEPGQRPPDVRIEVAKDEPDEVVPEPGPTLVLVPQAETARAQVPLASAAAILDSAKARLATLDMEIARLEGCKVERKLLAAMVAAAEGKT